uniref:Uncharacterized protein n=1 Tax=Aegilops tauschii subsp. strangulata TaxID=200361 RepID=A0A453LGA5_AEGTS
MCYTRITYLFSATGLVVVQCGILAYTFRDTGGDLFGAPTKNWPWEDGMNSMAMATRTLGLVTY